MRRIAVLAFIAGIAVITALVVSRGAGAVWHALAAIGWGGFAIVCLIHLALVVLMGISWLVIVPETQGRAARPVHLGAARAGFGRGDFAVLATWRVRDGRAGGGLVRRARDDGRRLDRR